MNIREEALAGTLSVRSVDQSSELKVVLPWCPQVPRKWNKAQVKRTFSIRLGKMLQNNPITSEDKQVRYLKALHVQWGNVTVDDLPEMWASPDEVSRFAVKQGDLLVCEGGEVGRAAVLGSINPPVIIQNALHRVRGKQDGEVRYLGYVLQLAVDAGWFEVLCNKATIAHLTSDKLGSLTIPLPTLDEQQTIAAFLDRETAKIDELIEKKQSLITLFAIKREAIIASAFTSHTSDSVRLPIKRLLTFTTSGSRGWAEFYSDEGDLFIQSGNLNRRLGLDLTVVQRIVPPEGAETQRTMIRRDDILVCITGAYTGNIAVVDFDPPRAFINQHVALLRVRHGIVARFVAYFLASSIGQGHFRASQYGGTKQGLGFEDIHSIPIPLPPLEDQVRIVRHLDSELQALEHAAAVVDKGILKLREYRSSLISATVTGQIDVRNYRHNPEAVSEVKRQG
jgi:type I restriction enzyme S subunit